MYASIAQLKQSGIPAKAVVSITDAILEQHLTEASALIDSYCRGRYATPLAAPYPSEIVRACSMVAAYSVIRWRGFRPGEYDENMRLAYEDTMAWLKDISRGAANLAIGADGTEASEGAPKVRARVASYGVASSGQRGW